MPLQANATGAVIYTLCIRNNIWNTSGVPEHAACFCPVERKEELEINRNIFPSPWHTDGQGQFMHFYGLQRKTSIKHWHSRNTWNKCFLQQQRRKQPVEYKKWFGFHGKSRITFCTYCKATVKRIVWFACYRIIISLKKKWVIYSIKYVEFL